MKQVSVNITQDILDEAVKSQIKELEKEIKKLKSQNAQLKRENIEHRESVGRVQDIIDAVRDAGFFEGYC